MLEENGKPHHESFGPEGINYFHAHEPCIEAVKNSGTTYVIFCPGVLSFHVLLFVRVMMPPLSLSFHLLLRLLALYPGSLL
jgi:hypothetical protein